MNPSYFFSEYNLAVIQTANTTKQAHISGLNSSPPNTKYIRTTAIAASIVIEVGEIFISWFYNWFLKIYQTTLTYKEVQNGAYKISKRDSTRG